MPVPNSKAHEMVYWQAEDGAIAATAQAGPNVTVKVTANGIVVTTRDGVPITGINSAGSARWLGLRLIEAATIWEREVNVERGDPT